MIKMKHILDNNYIPLSVPQMDGNEWKYVKECLDTGWVSSVGKYVEDFEQVVARHVGRKYAVACVNGTSALHTALLSLGLKNDEEIIVPTLTFAAPANVVRYCQAYPVFIDVEKKYWQMDVLKLKDFLKKECSYKNKRLMNKHTGRRIRGIIPVHVLGHPVDMDPVMGLAAEFGLWVIEDAAESIGATYKGQKVGAIGDMGCFSFNGNKIVTAGGGGMLVTDSKELADRARYLTTQAKDDSIEYVHHEIGYNYRLTNLQAAVGVAQMEQLGKYIQVKYKIASRYEKELGNISGLTLPRQAPWVKSIWWLYTILVNGKRYGKSSRVLLKKLADKNIQARPLWHPLHSLKPFQKCYAYRIEMADYLYEEALSLPSSVKLSTKDQIKIIQAIKDEAYG